MGGIVAEMVVVVVVVVAYVYALIMRKVGKVGRAEWDEGIAGMR
jgi:hypothetical protein